MGRRVSFLELCYSRNWCQSCLSSSMHDGIVNDREWVLSDSISRQIRRWEVGARLRRRQMEKNSRLNSAFTKCSQLHHPPNTTTLNTLHSSDLLTQTHTHIPITTWEEQAEKVRHQYIYIHTITSANAVIRRKGKTPQSRQERKERTRRRWCRIPSQAERGYRPHNPARNIDCNWRDC